MASYDEVKLEDIAHGSFATYNPNTAANKDADSLPTLFVYEEGSSVDMVAGVPLTSSVANITTGRYRFQLSVLAADGFEAGKYYEVWASATVTGSADTVTQSVPVLSFKATTSVQDDTYALASGATGFAAIDTVVDAVKVKTDFLPSATAGAAGGVFIAGTNAATVVTTSFTTTFTGNVTGSVASVTATVDANAIEWLGAAIATPTITGVPEVDITYINGSLATGAGTVDANLVQVNGNVPPVTNLEAFFDGSGYVGTGNTIPNVTLVATTTDMTNLPAGVQTSITNIEADTNELQLNQGAWATAVGFATPANVATELATYDGPTNTEMVAAFTEIKGATWSSVTDTLEAIRDQGDAAWITSTLAATDIVSAGAITTLAGAVVNVDLVDTLTTYTNDTPQSGDSFAYLGTNMGGAGANLTAADDAVIAAIAALNNISTSAVNAELLDVLITDTFAELSAPPAATCSILDRIRWNFMWSRNKATETATVRTLFADDTTTPISTEAVSDVAGTFTKGEAV